jgi:transposase InsO family protein
MVEWYFEKGMFKFAVVQNPKLLNEAFQDWRLMYNEIRPHGCIGFLSPVDFETDHKKLYFSVVAH